jgi:hypothetical protein
MARHMGEIKEHRSSVSASVTLTDGAMLVDIVELENGVVSFLLILVAFQLPQLGITSKTSQYSSSYLKKIAFLVDLFRVVYHKMLDHQGEKSKTSIYKNR